MTRGNECGEIITKVPVPGDRVRLKHDFYETVTGGQVLVPKGSEGIVLEREEEVHTTQTGTYFTAHIKVKFFEQRIIIKIREEVVEAINLTGSLKIDLQEMDRKEQEKRGPQWLEDPAVVEFQQRSAEIRHIKAHFARLIKAAFLGDVFSVIGEVMHMLTRRDKTLVKRAYEEMFGGIEEPGETLKESIL